MLLPLCESAGEKVGLKSTVGELLRAGADPNYEYSIGHKHKDIKSTVLILAARVGDATVVEMLFSRRCESECEGVGAGK